MKISTNSNLFLKLAYNSSKVCVIIKSLILCFILCTQNPWPLIISYVYFQYVCKSIFKPNTCGFLYMPRNLWTKCLIVFAVENFEIESHVVIQRERPHLILTPFDSTLALGCWSVPTPIRKQQIRVNAFMNSMGCYACLTKQSGSELCALISCLQGWVEKKGPFPTTCGSALLVFNQVHPWPLGQRIRITTKVFLYCLTTVAH